MGFQFLAFGLEFLESLVQFGPDRFESALDRVLLGHVMRGRPDRDVLDLVEDLPGQRVEMVNRFDLVPEQHDPEGGLRVGGHDLQHLALDPERTAAQHRVVALVLEPDQLAQHLVAVNPLPHLEQLHLLLVERRGADAVDAGNRGDDDHVPASQQRSGCRMPEPVDLVVDRGVLLDV